MTSSAPKPGPTFYRPELDVLRLAAFLLVFLHHILPHTASGFGRFGSKPLGSMILLGLANGGAYGVDLFFALSAYLITAIMLKEIRASGKIDVKAFYIRRILRIWPLYFAALFLIPPVMGALLPGQDMPAGYLVAFVFLSGNWACAVWGFPPTGVAPLWSVSIEEQFYVVWPLLMSRWSIRSMRTICLVLLAIAYVTRAILVYLDARDPAIWCNTFARLDPIVSGALLALFLDDKIPTFRAGLRTLLIAAGVAGMVLAGRFGANFGMAVLFTLPAVSIAALSMLVGTVGIQTDLRAHFPGRLAVHLGRISYGLYVFHYPAIIVLQYLPLSPRLWRVVALVCTVGLAELSYFYLESPFLRLKEKFAYVRSSSQAMFGDRRGKSR